MKDRVTPDQAGHAGRQFEGIIRHYSSSIRLQRALSHPEYKRRTFALIDELGAERVVTDHTEYLDGQVNRLIEVGAQGEAKIAKGKYHDQLMAAVSAFTWREDLAGIGLNKVALVDYRLSGRFLAEAGGVICYIEPDECSAFKGIVVPAGSMVIQYQPGSKYRGKAPRWCRQNFHTLEQGGVVKEGLTALLHEGKALLEECYMDLPGSVSPYGDVPYLGLWDGGPRLDDFFGGNAVPGFGSFSRGKCPSGAR